MLEIESIFGRYKIFKNTLTINTLSGRNIWCFSKAVQKTDFQIPLYVFILDTSFGNPKIRAALRDLKWLLGIFGPHLLEDLTLRVPQLMIGTGNKYNMYVTYFIGRHKSSGIAASYKTSLQQL